MQIVIVKVDIDPIAELRSHVRDTVNEYRLRNDRENLSPKIQFEIQSKARTIINQIVRCITKCPAINVAQRKRPRSDDLDVIEIIRKRRAESHHDLTWRVAEPQKSRYDRYVRDVDQRQSQRTYPVANDQVPITYVECGRDQVARGSIPVDRVHKL